MTGRKVLISMMVLSLIPTTHGFYSNNTVDIEESTGSQDLGKYPRSKYRPSLYFMNEHCEKTILLFSRNSIRISPWNDKYPPKSTSCRMGIKYAKYPAYYLSLTFHSIDMSRKIAGECETSRLDLYDGVVSSSSRRRISESVGICGKKAFKESYTTSGSFLTMIYTTHRLPHSYQNFVAVITPYHYGKCAGDEFKCANSRCIKNNNLCNSYDNCGDGSDEKSCAVLALSIAAIIGIAVGAAILIAIIVTIICCCCCCASCGYERF